MSLPGSYSEIRRIVVNWARRTYNARRIVRKAGLPIPSASGQAPAPILSLEGASLRCFEPGTQFFAGETANYALESSGKVYGWGSNTNNQFDEPYDYARSLGFVNGYGRPTRVLNRFTNLQAIAAGNNGTILLEDDGHIIDNGPPASDHEDAGDPYAEVGGLSGVTRASSFTAEQEGDEYALKSDGTIWARGFNLPGTSGAWVHWTTDPTTFTQMPTSETTSSVVEISPGGGGATFTRFAWRTSGGSIRLWQTAVQHHTEPTGAPSGVVKIASGISHVAALTSSGDIWVTGANEFGQAGIGSFDAGSFSTWRKTIGTGYSDMAVANFNTFALNGGELYSWGRTGPRLAQGTSAPDTHTPTVVSSPAVDDYVSLYAVCNSGAPMALRADGCVYTWGLNSFGQLGQGSTQPFGLFEPTQVLAARADPAWPI